MIFSTNELVDARTLLYETVASLIPNDADETTNEATERDVEQQE